MAKGLKGANIITVTGLGLTLVDAAASNECTTSHTVDITMGAASAIPGLGWILGGLYFSANENSKEVDRVSFGQTIDYAIFLYHFNGGGNKK